MDSTPISPVEFPTLEIDGVSYQLKYSTGAQLRMERMGYPPDKMREMFLWEKAEDGTERVVGTKLPMEVAFAWVAACAGKNAFGKWIPIRMTPEEIADTFTMAQFGAIGTALGLMFSKAKPEGNKPATLPASQPEKPESPFPVITASSIG
jgi:hypothetical protein